MLQNVPRIRSHHQTHRHLQTRNKRGRMNRIENLFASRRRADNGLRNEARNASPERKKEITAALKRRLEERQRQDLRERLTLQQELESLEGLAFISEDERKRDGIDCAEGYSKDLLTWTEQQEMFFTCIQRRPGVDCTGLINIHCIYYNEEGIHNARLLADRLTRWANGEKV